jgi:hypothetical protein
MLCGIRIEAVEKVDVLRQESSTVDIAPFQIYRFIIDYKSVTKTRGTLTV